MVRNRLLVLTGRLRCHRVRATRLARWPDLVRVLTAPPPTIHRSAPDHSRPGTATALPVAEPVTPAKAVTAEPMAATERSMTAAEGPEAAAERPVAAEKPVAAEGSMVAERPVPAKGSRAA
jgi:hypothetical protein